MKPFKALLPALFSAVLASRAAAVPPAFSSELAGAPGAGTLSYAEWLESQAALGAGAGAAAGAAAGVGAGVAGALSAGTDCSNPGQTSCPAVSSGKPVGQEMLSDPNKYFQNIGGVSYLCTGAGAGMAGPPDCRPCPDVCQKDEVAKEKAVAAAKEEDARKRQAAEDLKKKELADADKRMGFAGTDPAPGPTTDATQTKTAPVAAGDKGGQDLFGALTTGRGSGVSDVAVGGAGGGVQGGGPVVSPPPQQPGGGGTVQPVPSQALNGVPLDQIVNTVATAVADVQSRILSGKLSNGSVTSYGAAGGPGGPGAADNGGVPGRLLESGSCDGTYASLCDEKHRQRMEAMVKGSLIDWANDGKGGGANNPGNLKRDTNTFGAVKSKSN